MVGILLQLLRTFSLLGRALAEQRGRALVGFVALQLLAGTIFYSNVEGWRLIDALYFCVTTLATVGLGDLAPVTDAGRIFTIMYILTGVGVLLALLDYMAERAGRRRA